MNDVAMVLVEAMPSRTEILKWSYQDVAESRPDLSQLTRLRGCLIGACYWNGTRSWQPLVAVEDVKLIMLRAWSG